MNSAEMKLDLFRKIDSLDDKQMEKLYTRLLKLLNTASSEGASLSPELKAALDEAMEASIKGRISTHEDVIQITREKYPRLFI